AGHGQQGNDGFSDRGGAALRADLRRPLVPAGASAILAAVCWPGTGMDSDSGDQLSRPADATGRLSSGRAGACVVADADASAAAVSEAGRLAVAAADSL